MDITQRQQRVDRRNVVRGDHMYSAELQVINDCATPYKRESSIEMDTTEGGVSLAGFPDADTHASTPAPRFLDMHFDGDSLSDGEIPQSHPDPMSSDSDSDNEPASHPPAPFIASEPPTSTSKSTLNTKQLKSFTRAFAAQSISVAPTQPSRKRRPRSSRIRASTHEIFELMHEHNLSVEDAQPHHARRSAADGALNQADQQLNQVPVKRERYSQAHFDAQRDEKVKAIVADEGCTRHEALKRLDQKGVNKKLRKAAKRELQAGLSGGRGEDGQSRVQKPNGAPKVSKKARRRARRAARKASCSGDTEKSGHENSAAVAKIESGGNEPQLESGMGQLTLVMR